MHYVFFFNLIILTYFFNLIILTYYIEKRKFIQSMACNYFDHFVNDFNKK